ncbi:hypothetical protein D3C72_2421130 [compost metagenome]
MSTANLATSDGWKPTGPMDSQRRAPLTTLPTPGISTATSSSSAATKSQGAARSQSFMGTWKASSAATKPTTRYIMWRVRKCVDA